MGPGVSGPSEARGLVCFGGWQPSGTGVPPGLLQPGLSGYGALSALWWRPAPQRRGWVVPHPCLPSSAVASPNTLTHPPAPGSCQSLRFLFTVALVIFLRNSWAPRGGRCHANGTTVYDTRFSSQTRFTQLPISESVLFLPTPRTLAPSFPGLPEVLHHAPHYPAPSNPSPQGKTMDE